MGTFAVGGGFDSAHYPWHQVCGVAYRHIGELHEAWSQWGFFGGVNPGDWLYDPLRTILKV